ncbi:hypothetical protein L9F63_013308, partial [Diploptera punctata]
LFAYLKKIQSAKKMICMKDIGKEQVAGDGKEPDKKRPRLDVACDSSMDTSIEEQNSELSKNINLITLNPNLVLKSGLSFKGPLAHKVMKQQMENDPPRSVFDIIVQHNIAAQAKIPVAGGRAVPMVYIPETNSYTTLQNETAARISELKQQAFEDWSRCLTPDANGNIPLHKAVIYENLTLIKRQCVVLYARKASLDVPNNEKKTPLHLAVEYGNAEIAKILLNFGAQPRVKDCDGNTSLHLAVIEGNYQCVEAVLNYSKDPSSLPLDDFNDEGYAPMHLCALRGKVKECRLLLNKGADVNLKDARSGRTPLFHAVEANSGELVQLLLEADANTNEPNFAGHTPLTAASEISYSARPNVKDGVADGINFSSKLVSLRSGEDIGQIIEDGSNIVISGDIVEDISMDEDNEVMGAESYSRTTRNVNSSNVWAPDV